MSDEALFHTSCPSCGAPVYLHSATAISIVCNYCNSLLVHQDNSLTDTGRDCALLSDFSPLQIGTSGCFAAQAFSIIGRLQVQYEAGTWNEWYLKFKDGSDGWLSEAGDIYTLTRASATPPNPPDFTQIRAGESTVCLGKTFVASDVREITLTRTAAQGELPFELPENYTNHVADWRCENAFLTLDYATQPPQAFLGRTVKLSELALQNTRDDSQIRQSSGSLKGERHSENCPHCGSPIQWIHGITPTVLCPNCGSDLDTSGLTAQLIAANQMREAQQDSLTLPLGKHGKLNNHHYTVIGAVRQDEIESIDARRILNNPSLAKMGIIPQGWWIEYLLYSPQHGFAWLIETPNEGWSVSETLTHFPYLNTHLQPQGCSPLYAYGGRVSYACGAFYWHIRANDVTLYQDYQQGKSKLCAESTRTEWAWSKSTPIAFSHIAQAFGLSHTNEADNTQSEPITRSLRFLLIGVFVVLNLPTWFLASSDDLEVIFTVSIIVIMQLYHMGNKDND